MMKTGLLVISLTLGEGTSIGLIFGIPLLISGLVVIALTIAVIKATLVVLYFMHVRYCPTQ